MTWSLVFVSGAVFVSGVKGGLSMREFNLEAPATWKAAPRARHLMSDNPALDSLIDESTSVNNADADT